MRRTIPLLPILFSAAFAMSLLVTPTLSWAQEEEPEFSELRALIEINTTDGDAGLQILIDGDGWRKVRVDDPNGQKIFEVKGSKSVKEQGLTENFFESAEPSCDEEGFSLTDTLDRFPAGEYRVSGKSIDNEQMEGEAILTHALPGAPENLLPDGGVVDATLPVMIKWTPGDELGNCPPNDADILDPGAVPLFGYQLVVEREVPGPLLVFGAEVPAGTTSVTISPEFMQMGAFYKYEVVAIEQPLNEDGSPVLNEDGHPVKGNQSITENFFCTAPLTTVECNELAE